MADPRAPGMTSEAADSSVSPSAAAAPGTAAGDMGPNLREVLSRIWAEVGARPGGGGPYAMRRLTGSIVDLAVTLSLLAAAANLAMASLAGFIAGAVVELGVRARTPAGTTAPRAVGDGLGTTTGRSIAVAALALGVRGGALATLIAAGLPVWIAAVCAVAASTVVGYLGIEYYVLRRERAEPAGTSPWALAAIGVVAYVVLLHVLNMWPVPVMPQEAYYWNYSVHPDFGYHDHPPMVAWLIAAGEFVLGHGPAGVRLGALACGLAVITFAYLLARRLVDRTAAMLAAALAAALPYFFFASGAMMTPDAPLAAAWAAALYYFHRALVGGERRAWLGVGVAIGFGLLSKYTIALLGPAALAFCLVDKRARGWLIRPEPYLAMLAAALLFVPVVYWNFVHDWASFKFQTGDRFGTQSRFSLHRLLGNVLVVATPLPLLALPLLFSGQWTAAGGAVEEPAHADARNRRFVACFVLVPLAVFSWDALRHLPRLNWTGPLWLAILPLAGWAIVHARALRARRIGSALRVTAPHLLGGLLVVYALLYYYLVLGFPGVGYPKEAAPLLGWSGVARELASVGSDIEARTGAAPVIVGMDAYQIASELSFYGKSRDLAAGEPATRGASGPRALQVTAIGRLFGGEGLMFAYWNPPASLRGRTLIMVALRPEELQKPTLAAHFARLDLEIRALPLVHSGYGGQPKSVDNVYYRIGYGYLPDVAGP